MRSELTLSSNVNVGGANCRVTFNGFEITVFDGKGLNLNATLSEWESLKEMIDLIVKEHQSIRIPDLEAQRRSQQ